MKKICISCSVCIVLLVIFFILSISISSVFIYFYWYLKNSNTGVTNIKCNFNECNFIEYIMGNIKEINIKNGINITNFDPNLVKIDKKSYKNIDITLNISL